MYIVQIVNMMEQGFVPDAYSVNEANLVTVIDRMLKKEAFTYGVPKYVRIIAVQDGVASFELDK